jgi:hypothetical protein
MIKYERMMNIYYYHLMNKENNDSNRIDLYIIITI